MFRLEGVSKVYHRVHALDRIDLEIEAGQRVAVVGSSGSGKTTLLRLLSRLILPDQGQVWIDDQPSHRLAPGPQLSRRVGMMSQQFDLVDALPVVHNVLAGRLGQWGLLRSLLSLLVPQDLPLARAALERVGIADKLYQRTGRLSGGEQQRVALARLLVQDPRAFLADEPVASLDPARAEDLIRMLTDVAAERGKTLVCSLHDPQLARRYFDRMVGLQGGRLRFDRPAARVSERDLQDLYRLPEVGAVR